MVFAKRDSACGKHEENTAMKFLDENVAIKETFGRSAFGISAMSQLMHRTTERTVRGDTRRSRKSR